MTHSVTLSGLASNTSYYGRIVVSTADREEVYGEEFSFTTYSTITLSNLAVGSIAQTGAQITWDTNVATTHQIEYGAASGVYTISTVQSTVPETVHAVSLSGLTAGTTYYYRVKNFHSTLGNTFSLEQSFTTAAVIPEPAPTAAQKQRGIWLVGGQSAQSMANPVNTIGTVDLFDPVTNTWYPAVTTLPIPVSFAAAVGYQGKIYVIGGFDPSSTPTPGSPIGNTQIYDIATNTWSAGAAMSNARANHSAVVINGKIYVTRGTTGAYNAAWIVTGVPTNTLIYTIATNSWASTGVVDSAVSNKSAVVLGDIVYYLGGKSNTSTLVNTFDGIATSANALTTGITELVLSSVRVGHSSVAYTDANGADHILVMGGFSALTNTGCYALNTATAATALNTFQYIRAPFVAPSAWVTASGTLPYSIGFGSAVVSGTTVYYFGGTRYSPVAAENYVFSYDLNSFPSGSWVNNTGSPMSRARFGHDAVIAY